MLDLLYKKLSWFRKELIINASSNNKFEIEERIKQEIAPQMRQYEREYWELYPQENIIILFPHVKM